jgi:hypothetical protein
MSDSTLRTLAKSIAETRPIERSRRLALQAELRSVRESVDPRAREASQRLDAALLILEFMNRSEDVVTADTLQTVAGLVASVDERSLRQQAPHERAAPAPPRRVGEMNEHGDLALTDQLLLGTILLQARIISQESLVRALHLHASSGAALGQCLIRLSAATPAQIAGAIAYQDRARELRAPAQQTDATGPAAPAAAPSPAPPGAPPAPKLELRLSSKQRGLVHSFNAQVLGEILIRQGAVTRAQLEHALQVQRACNKHIGEVLVETRAASWAQVKRALETQKQLRRSAA